MGFETDGGMEQTRLMLRRLVDIERLAIGEFERVAQETLQMAKDMAPVEYGDLEKSIHMTRRGTSGRFASAGDSGVISYTISVRNEQKLHSDKPADKTVGDYAWEVHERMGWGNTPGAPTKTEKGSFMPSDHSVAVGNQRGVEAGGKFIERAGEHARASMLKRLISVIAKKF